MLEKTSVLNMKEGFLCIDWVLTSVVQILLPVL